MLLLIWLWREVTCWLCAFCLFAFHCQILFVSKSVFNLAFKLFFVSRIRLVSGCSIWVFFYRHATGRQLSKKRLPGVGNPLWQSAFPVPAPQVLSSFCYFSFHTCRTLQPQMKTCFCWGLFSRFPACLSLPLCHSLSLAFAYFFNYFAFLSGLFLRQQLLFPIFSGPVSLFICHWVLSLRAP